MLQLLQRPKRPLITSTPLFEKLDDYQKHAVKFALKVRTAGLFFEQGTGKTWIAGAIADQLATRPDFSALFIVPLTNLESTWAAFFRDQCPYLDVFHTLGEFNKSRSLHRILLVHYEALPRIIKALRKRTWTLIAVDESHRIKERNTRQSKNVGSLSDYASYKILLSGTPMEDSPADLWGQFRFARPSIFGTRWKDFENEYFDPIEDFDHAAARRKGAITYQRLWKKHIIERSKRTFNDDMRAKFDQLIEPYSLRITKEVLNLPPLDIVDEYVGLHGKQLELYEQMQDTLVGHFNDRTVTAPLKITLIGKLHQICGGYLFDDDGEVHEVGRAKLRRVLRIVERHKGEPVAVFCRYVEEVRALQEALTHRGLRVAAIHGKVSKKERPKVINNFQSGKLDVIICQIRTGGVGIDLFTSHIGVMYSCTYSFIDFEQAIARLHRRGQKNPVVFYLLSARNTIDEVIYSAIRSKRKMTNKVLVKITGDYLWQKLRAQKSHHTMLTGSRKTLGSRRRPSALRSARPKSKRSTRSMNGRPPKLMAKFLRS